MVYSNPNCKNNDLLSDPSKIDSLKYSIFLFISDYSEKLDLTTVKNNTPIMWLDPKINKEEIDLINITGFVQIAFNYPQSINNNAEIGFRYDTQTKESFTKLKAVKNAMSTVLRNTHLRVLPNLFTKEMIESYFQKQGKETPNCTFDQKYYTSVDCNQITNIDIEKYKINEYIQQYCHAHINSKSYLDYMENFFDQCISYETNSNIDDNEKDSTLKFYFCGKNLREKSKYAKKIKECFNISYNHQYEKTLKPELLKNNLLESVLDYISNIWNHDSVQNEAKLYLNSALYKQNDNNLIENMCSTFIRTPTECNLKKLSWELIAVLIVIAVFCLIEVIMYFVHFGKLINNKTSLIPFAEKLENIPQDLHQDFSSKSDDGKEKNLFNKTDM